MVKLLNPMTGEEDTTATADQTATQKKEIAPIEVSVLVLARLDEKYYITTETITIHEAAELRSLLAYAIENKLFVDKFDTDDCDPWGTGA